MHELGITENIVSIALEKANEVQASKIVSITLVIGELSGVVPDCIQFYFGPVSKATIAREAVLHFRSAPAELRCRDCYTAFPPEDTMWSCPQCRGQRLEILRGRELYVESLEVE